MDFFFNPEQISFEAVRFLMMMLENQIFYCTCCCILMLAYQCFSLQLKKRKQKLRKSRGLAASESGQLEDSTNFELSASSSETGSSSDDLDRDKKEALNKKRKRAGQDADGNVTWTDESVRFLFETYDAIHQRLWEESNGQVKYQKKWTPILKAMQDRFGKHFSKKQCQSKYWSVRRECTDYR